MSIQFEEPPRRAPAGRRHTRPDSRWRRVLVINQFAMPRTEWGLTRNADLFGAVSGWHTTIVAADRDHYSQRIFTTTDPLFRLVSVPAYRGAGLARIVGWLIFSVRACWIGLRSPRPDVVYASTPQLVSALAGWVVARVRRAAFVLEVRDLWPESIVAAGHLRRGSTVHRLLVRLERFLYEQARRIVVVTWGWEEHFADLGVSTDKLHVIPNGVDAEVSRGLPDKARLRDAHAIQGFTAIYAGAHGKANGLDQLLDAAAELPQVNFLLVGAGPEKERLVARAAREGLTNVAFRQPVPKTQLPALLKACDVGVHVLAPWELLARGLSPNKVFDYMAAGLPVVSNCAEGLRKIISDGECGRLGAADGLAACLAAAFSAGDDVRARWAQTGERLVRERFSRSANVELLTDVLNSLVPQESLPLEAAGRKGLNL